MSTLLILWDRLVMRVTGEDETCGYQDTRLTDEPGGPGVLRTECTRRWSHTGRHVQRDLP